MLSRYVHGAFFVRVKHIYRILIVTCLTLASFTLISYACFNDDKPQMFWVSVLSSVLVGIAQGFGEAVIFGFLKGFPSYMIGDVSTGTGFAGPFGSFSVLLFRGVLNIKNIISLLNCLQYLYF